MNRHPRHNRGQLPALTRADRIEWTGPYWPAGRELTAQETARLLADGVAPHIDSDLAASNNWAYEVQS